MLGNEMQLQVRKGKELMPGKKEINECNGEKLNKNEYQEERKENNECQEKKKTIYCQEKKTMNSRKQ